MTTTYVTYPGDAGTRFDRDHYVRAHLPLVLEAWGPHGLETAAAFFPPSDGAGTIAVCICRFRDEVAVASSRTADVIADVENFTDAESLRARAGYVRARAGGPGEQELTWV